MTTKRTIRNVLAHIARFRGGDLRLEGTVIYQGRILNLSTLDTALMAELYPYSEKHGGRWIRSSAGHWRLSITVKDVIKQEPDCVVLVNDLRETITLFAPGHPEQIAHEDTLEAGLNS